MPKVFSPKVFSVVLYLNFTEKNLTKKQKEEVAPLHLVSAGLFHHHLNANSGNEELDIS